MSVGSGLVSLAAGPPGNVTVMLRIVDDSRGGEGDESVELTLELVSPMDFSHLIDLNPDGGGVSSSLTITIIDDDEGRSDMYMHQHTVFNHVRRLINLSHQLFHYKEVALCIVFISYVTSYVYLIITS